MKRLVALLVLQKLAEVVEERLGDELNAPNSTETKRGKNNVSSVMVHLENVKVKWGTVIPRSRFLPSVALALVPWEGGG